MPNRTFSFSIVSSYMQIPEPAKYQGFLVKDDWDDWFQFETLFKLVIKDNESKNHTIGDVKIGQFEMVEQQRTPDIPGSFGELDERFFSLGQDDSYYERLNDFDDELRDLVLRALRDVAVDISLFELALEESVTKISLLRFVQPLTVRGQFHRLASGGARLSRYEFTYETPKRSGNPSVLLSFKVEPESNPPTNIHVLIGRNGVGKTHIMNNMTRALVENGSSSKRYGVFTSDQSGSGLFANLVSVSFSAFDQFELISEKKDKTAGMPYSYVGLRRTSNRGGEKGTPKSPDMLAREFADSARNCLHGARKNRWLKALDMLEGDPIFKSAGIRSLAENEDSDVLRKQGAYLFDKLSSGHKIILLTLTRLVETVEERTLVLLDEPEGHLHPPLFAAFVRALSDLLVDRNGVAIIATHSPVVLQEVPKSCVWKVRRTGHLVVAERPEEETFGENVGILTREVFGLEVTKSGFHKLLQDAIEQEGSINSVLSYFENELGGEARAIIQALISARDIGSED